MEVAAVSNQADVLANINSISLNVIQNNNFNMGVFNVKTNSVMEIKYFFSNWIWFSLGNNEFYYFDNKIIDQPFDAVASVVNNQEGNHTYLHSVWAYPLNYQYHQM